MNDFYPENSAEMTWEDLTAIDGVYDEAIADWAWENVPKLLAEIKGLRLAISDSLADEFPHLRDALADPTTWHQNWVGFSDEGAGS
jgi:hypothetical protein